MKGLWLLVLAGAQDPAMLRQEMQQERKLLNAKVAEADAAKAQATGLEAQLNSTRQALLATQAKDGQQLAELRAGLAAAQLRDSNLTEMLAQARVAQRQQVAALEQELSAASGTRLQEEQHLQAQVLREQVLEAQEVNSSNVRIAKIRDVLKGALAVPVAVPSPFKNSSAKLTLAKLGNTTLSVEDTVDDNLEHSANSLAHQDRVLNWAFRKLNSEGTQLKALNISKVASEQKANVLEKELAVEQELQANTSKALSSVQQGLAAELAQDAGDRAAADSRLADAELRLTRVHTLVAQAAQD